MKKLLYTLALVALSNYSGFGQCSNYSPSVDFTAPVAGSIIPLNAGISGSVGFKVSALNLTTFNTLGTLITAISVTSSGGHVTSITTSTVPSSSGSFGFTVKTPNAPGSETFTVTATYNTAGATGCTAIGVVSVNTTPIELLSFVGKQTNSGAVKLNWVTASEKDNALFMVERSNNGVDFTAVGEVKGSGNSSSNIDYTYTDASAINNAVNYYRLTDVDVNGVKSSSRVISVIVGKNAPLVIDAISSVQGFASVVSPSNGTADLTISDVQGRVLSSVKSNLVEGANTVQINTENLGTGIYFLSIVNNSTSAQTKFFKN